MNKTYPYIWHWKKKLPERKGQPCRVLEYRDKNSILVEFDDGFTAVTARWAIRRKRCFVVRLKNNYFAGFGSSRCSFGPYFARKYDRALLYDDFRVAADDVNFINLFLDGAYVECISGAEHKLENRKD